MIRPLQAFFTITLTVLLCTAHARAGIAAIDSAGSELALSMPQQADQDEINLVVFYPNPVKDMLTIKFPHKGNAIVTIYNIIGDKVMTKVMEDDNELRLDLHDLQNGMYFISYDFDGKLLTKRFSKTS